MAWKKYDFFVLGYFGWRTNQLDGQTVKTRNVHLLLKENLNGKTGFFDTETLKDSKLNLLILIWNLLRSKNVVYLPGGNNLRKFSGILTRLQRWSSFNIHYFVVGGWLPDVLIKQPDLVPVLASFNNILVETKRMQRRLEVEQGFKNVSIFENYRDFEPLFPRRSEEGSVLKLVFLSRINKRKGLEVIFNALKQFGSQIDVTFYGPIFKDDEGYFNKSIAQFENAHFGGILEQKDIIERLNQFDVLLLPTNYYTEGLPGAIVDAYFAGIPVLVTNWLHADEFVVNNETGVIVDFDNPQVPFNAALAQFLENRELLNTLKMNAFHYSERFSKKHVLEQLSQLFQSK